MDAAVTRVALLTHTLAHYRRPLYCLLADNVDGRHSYEVFASEVPNDDVKVLDRASVRGTALYDKWSLVQNVWLTRTMLWQRRVVSALGFGGHDVLIVAGNVYFLSTWLVVLIARIRRKRILMWTHGLRRSDHGLKRVIRMAFYCLADGLLLYGRRAQDLLKDRTCRHLRLYVVSNALDYSSQRAIREKLESQGVEHVRAQLGIEQDVVLILAIGRLTERKRWAQLISAMALLKARGQRPFLVVVGDGPMAAALKAQVAAEGLDLEVRFAGACYDEETIARYMTASDLSVVPGDVGLSAIHALTYGCPVITHDNMTTHGPEAEAIVEGRTGSSFRENDVHHMVTVIEQWTKSLSSPEARRHTREACIATVEQRYTPEYMKHVFDLAVAGTPAATTAP